MHSQEARTLGRPSESTRFSPSLAPPTSSARYVRHRPETTLLYQVVREYWPEFQAELSSHSKHLPAFICREFDEYLKCGRLEHGFLRVRCETCHHEKLVAFSCKRRGFCPSCGARRMADSAALLVDEVLPHQPMRQWVLSVPFPLRFLFASQPAVMGKVLGIVYRAIATHLRRKAGCTKTTAHTGAVTLIQRFGGALNLNIHFHMLFLDGAYLDTTHGSGMRFRRIRAPTSDELTRLTHTIARRIARYLERQGLLERDVDGAWLTSSACGEEDEAAIHRLLGSSITYRIAVGPQQGRKVFTLQTLPDCRSDFSRPQTGHSAGFSLHAGVATQAHERDKLERLCRYIARPAVSNQRLSLTRNGQIRYQLKTPYTDGTTHVLFEPLDFIAHLVALVPRPRVNLTRFHGVFAPNSKHRGLITPAQRGKGKKGAPPEIQKTPPQERHMAMTWARRLKRVFDIDIESCSQCGGAVKIIASIEDPAVIRKILAHLDKNATSAETGLLPDCRAPPRTNLFEENHHPSYRLQ